MRLVLLAMLPACSLYFGSSTGGGGGSGGLWVASRNEPGDYYAIADVWIDHYDANLAQLSEWHSADDYTTVQGLAFTGDALWVNYNELGTCNCHVRALDPSTGTELGRFATDHGITGLTYDGSELLLSYAWSEVIAMNPTTGAQDWTISTPLGEGGTQVGLAYQAGNIWIATYWSDELYVIDEKGHTTGSAYTSLLPGDPGDEQDQIAWVDASTLVIVADNQMTWVAVHPR